MTDPRPAGEAPDHGPDIELLNRLRRVDYDTVIVVSDLHMGPGIDPITGMYAREENFFGDHAFLPGSSTNDLDAVINLDSTVDDHHERVHDLRIEQQAPRASERRLGDRPQVFVAEIRAVGVFRHELTACFAPEKTI